MCRSRKHQQQTLQIWSPVEAQQQSRCAARRQQRRELRALAANNSPALETYLVKPAAQQNHWTEYQPRTMAGMLVMGVALGLQEGGKKIKEKRDERKAKKAALAAEAYAPAESSSSGAARSHFSRSDTRPERKSEEARREQKRRSFSSERTHHEDAPPSYDEVARPTYEEAMRDTQYRT